MGHRATLAALVLAPLVLAGGVPAVGRSVAAVGPTCDGRTPTIVGTEGSDRLTGTPGDDVIAGLGGRDLIAGGAGDDVVCGDAGPDEITGGEGDDRLYGGTNGRLNVFESQAEPAGDVVVPGPGDDLVDLGVNTVLRRDGWNAADTLDLSGSTTGVTVDLIAGTAVGEGADTLVVAQPQPALGYVVELLGSSYSDHLLGTEGPDQLIGNGGGDRIDARGGDDLVMNAWDEYSPPPGENADDVFDGGAGDDSLDSTGGRDTMTGGPGRDHLRKERGATTMDGGPDTDVLELYLSRGGHTVTGGDGVDAISVSVLRRGTPRRPAWGTFDHRRGVFRAGTPDGGRVRLGVDALERVTMPGAPGRWTYLGTPGDDRVGGGAAYTARGRGGDDRLEGSYADDVLLGGPGRDRVRGRGGTDRCRGETTRGCE
ncbi:hypothetical protein ASG88_19970 [Nocardioides sp. Soil777]|uniref:calcium-binding protein n=1 Tax=Nocardioides sp. Soil777 TaxID=1736409 RepID=UPI00070347A3|nr:calcium-binding protein [Nocardioides sp. Soil777]KRF06434.1 hypothetical protein ASG88_19970 [Nocardioides sp. Soil777]